MQANKVVFIVIDNHQLDVEFKNNSTDYFEPTETMIHSCLQPYPCLSPFLFETAILNRLFPYADVTLFLSLFIALSHEVSQSSTVIARF